MIAKLKEWGLSRDIFMLGLARAVDSFGASLMIIIIPLFVEHYGISFRTLSSTFVIGIILSTYGITNTMVQPGVGVLIDKTRLIKSLISSGLGIYATATLLFIWTQSFGGLLVLRIIQGIGVALTIPATLTLMTEYTKVKTRGTAMSFYNVMRLIGFACGPVVGGYLITYLDFPIVIAIAGAAGFAGSILVQLLVVEPPVEPSQKEPKTIYKNLSQFLNPEMYDFLKLAFANVSMALAISLVAPLENEFNTRLNQSPGEFGIAFSSLIITVMIVQIPIGRIADTIGRKVLIVTGLMILTPATIWMGYVAFTYQFILARMIQGVGVGCVAAPSFALGGDKSKEGKRGKEMSLLSMAFGMGIGLGPLLAGLLAGKFSFQAPFWFASILLLLSCFVVGLTVPKTVLPES